MGPKRRKPLRVALAVDRAASASRPASPVPSSARNGEMNAHSAMTPASTSSLATSPAEFSQALILPTKHEARPSHLDVVEQPSEHQVENRDNARGKHYETECREDLGRNR